MKNFLINTLTFFGTFAALSAMTYGYLDYRVSFLSPGTKFFVSLAVVSGSAIISTLIFGISRSR